VLEQERIDRGRDPGRGRHRARAQRAWREGTYERTYPTGEEFANADRLLLHRPNLGQTGIERFRNAALNGQTGTNLQSGARPAAGQAPQGEKVSRRSTRPRSASRSRRSANTKARWSRSTRAPGRSGDGLHAEL
jgi:hypothetical protein